MNPATRAFLRQYLRLLRSIDTAEAAYRKLPKWQVEQRSAWQAVRADLNDTLGLADDTELLDHIPTSLVGRLDGLVTCSANPGWDGRRNPREDAARRANVESNWAFIRDFFSRYPEVTRGTSGWWTRVLRRLGRVRQDRSAAVLGGKALWRHVASQRWQVGGIDLVPFHSKRDGVTRLLLAPETDAARLLQEIAREMLLLVAGRIRPPALLVASGAGAVLFDDNLARQAGFGRATVLERPHGLWFDAKRYGSEKDDSCVLVLPRQVFSGSLRPPPDQSLEGLVPLLREHLLPRVERQARKRRRAG